jgi:type IV secretory pathway VirJ component
MRAAVLCLVVAVTTAAADPPVWRRRVDALDLPISVVEAAVPRAVLVFVTGDGGWQSVDRALADGIAREGITTVALSAFKYFVTTKEPAQVAADLRRIVDAVEVGLPVYLGGYSFGAEVVPEVLAKEWRASERERIRGLLLLAPGHSASFRVDPRDWVREPAPDTRHLVEDAVRRLAPSRVVCIAGVDDDATVCDRLAGLPGVAVVHVPGTHHFENGMPRVVEAAVRELFARERKAR